MEYDDRKFVIFDISELYKIDFTQVLETSPETIRVSLDGTKTFVKWEGEVPECITSLETRSEYLTYDKLMTILLTPEWQWR